MDRNRKMHATGGAQQAEIVAQTAVAESEVDVPFGHQEHAGPFAPISPWVDGGAGVLGKLGNVLGGRLHRDVTVGPLPVVFASDSPFSEVGAERLSHKPPLAPVLGERGFRDRRSGAFSHRKDPGLRGPHGRDASLNAPAKGSPYPSLARQACVRTDHSGPLIEKTPRSTNTVALKPLPGRALIVSKAGGGEGRDRAAGRGLDGGVATGGAKKSDPPLWHGLPTIGLITSRWSNPSPPQQRRAGVS